MKANARAGIKRSRRSVAKIKYGDREGTSEEAFNAIFRALFYQDWKAKPPSSRTFEFVNQIKSSMSECDVLFIEGLMKCHSHSEIEKFKAAERKGCYHPFLYYHLAKYYSQAAKRRRVVSAKALECCMKSISGKYFRLWEPLHPLHLLCSLHPFQAASICLSTSLSYFCQPYTGGWMPSLLYIYSLCTNSFDRKGLKQLCYLLDLEREGNMDGQLFISIGYRYNVCNISNLYTSMTLEYYQRAIDIGYAPAYLRLHEYWCNTFASLDEGPLALVEAEKRGFEDDRILGELVSSLCEYDTPSKAVHKGFNDFGEMILHYCDVLIGRGSPHGHYFKGGVYWRGYHGITKDEAKAISIWEEGDRLGLDYINRTHLTLPGLMSEYK